MMKIFLSFLLVGLATISCAQKKVTQEEFKKLMKNPSAQILDVRTAQEVAAGKIAGSVNVDYFSASFKESVVKKLDKNKPVLVYCAAGGRSASAASDLKKAGFKHVYDLEGGYDSWRE
jgi:rhodanese-related sulfurtransferase